jgi:hypothetical protein
MGQDAKPALPVLRKLKLDADAQVRKAASEIVRRLEGE